MTKDRFRNIIIERNRTANRFNKLLASVLILIGLIFIVVIVKNGLKINSDNRTNILISQIGILILPLIPIIGGLTFFIFIPKQYSVYEIIDKSDNDSKLDRFKNSLNDYKINNVQTFIDYYRFECFNNFLSGFIIYLYIDKDKYLINVLSGQYENKPGVYDFGLSKRIARKIMVRIQQQA